jgi:hypothetical protein
MAAFALAGIGEKRSLRVACLALLALLGAGAVLVPADAAERGVSVGEVSTRVVRANMDLEALLRASLDRALRDLDLRRASPGKPVVLSASLQDMAVDSSTRSATCSISVALRSARGGAMFAVLEGRVRVAFESGRPVSVESRAIDAAVRAALARVPEAIR